MKRCPSCNRVETDDTLAFCRADGTPLVSDSLSASESNRGFVAASPSSEIETSILPHSTDAGISRATGATTVFDAQPALARTQKLASSKSRRALVFASAGLIVLALGFWIYFYRTRNSNPTTIDSIAVLPFANTSGDPNTDFLSDGITQSIISSLSQLSQLKVMAGSTVFQYKGKDVDPRKVGHDLGVRAVLTGKLIQQGDNLTIRTELVNVSDGTELWGQQYNRKLADVFAIQEEIAREISEKLRLKLSGSESEQLPKRPTENLKAFQYYMQGRASAQRRIRQDLFTAIGYYEKALQEDHNYSLAYAGLADAYGASGVFGYIAPIEGRRKAEEAARKALALDENLGEAHAALGITYTFFSPSDFSLGDRELRRAIELSASLAPARFYLGLSLVRQGRLDEGSEQFRKARELDPLSSIIARAQALPYYLKRDYGGALERLRQANELGAPFSTTFEIGIYIQNKLSSEALTELDRAKRERQNDPILTYDTGMAYAAQGKRAEALQSLNELEVM